ncbi:hypothetical protein Gbem_4128 [Citrifermentans bemidjiense Bem]|uniref:Uncharacterized protein n=1 Tax=Citrifermentans bemidjiense (strain ATCC BAA-1014 / DSM 16622 / JCM 12645 / Bem) TaxID=404380 RepID=E1P6D0_CITBB|nr:hypothetical protein Gbem_4128 [Citrifermentans bemidjiense Bem]
MLLRMIVACTDAIGEPDIYFLKHAGAVRQRRALRSCEGERGRCGYLLSGDRKSITISIAALTLQGSGGSSNAEQHDGRVI